MRLVFICLVFLLLDLQLSATHIVGGNLKIAQTGPNTFTITCFVFRDCAPGNAAMPTSLSVGVYYKTTNVLQQSLTITNPMITTINLGDSCYTPSGICIQEGVFTSTSITIPNNAAGYYIETELYARNNGITNLNNPGSQGMTFYAEIPDPAIVGMNNSPEFGSYPTTGYFCTNVQKQFTFDISESDGDSLAYSLVAPLGSNISGNGTSPAPYSDIIWQTPYNTLDMVGGNPVMTIHPSNGTITAGPSIVGLFAFAFKVEEFRNGIKIGEVRMDIQFPSIICDTCSFLPINEMDISPFNIYPNPFHNVLNINTNTNDFSLVIYDLNGKIVYQNKSIYNYFRTESLNFLQARFYLLKIENSSKNYYYKVIKE